MTVVPNAYPDVGITLRTVLGALVSALLLFLSISVFFIVWLQLVTELWYVPILFALGFVIFTLVTSAASAVVAGHMALYALIILVSGACGIVAGFLRWLALERPIDGAWPVLCWVFAAPITQPLAAAAMAVLIRLRAK